MYPAPSDHAQSTMAAELAVVLRSWRDRTDPRDVGLARTSRRVSGLRREELAALAGLSVDYVVKLEQGKVRSPSESAMRGIASALKITAEEQVYLYRLVGIAGPNLAAIPRDIPPQIARVLDRLADLPLGVYGPDWTLIWWNALWRELLGPVPEPVGYGRNLLWAVFTGAPSRVESDPGHREQFARALVADLRGTVGRYPLDTAISRLIDEIRSVSAEFENIWRSAEVATLTSEHKRVIHPELGAMDLDCDVLTVAGSDLRVVVYTADPGTNDARQLEHLQNLASGKNAWG